MQDAAAIVKELKSRSISRLLMGRESDAEAAASNVLRTDPELSVGDYAKAFPYKEKNDLNCVIEALRKAGLK
jgi:hypothetical protein